MRHLRNAAIELVKDLSENGLNGVSFYEAEVNHATRPEDDDMGAEAAEAWDRDYCTVILGPDCDMFDCIHEADHGYFRAEFDWGSFERDLREKFVEYFGKDVIECLEKHHNWRVNLQGCGETEVYRRSSAWRDFDGNSHDKPFDPLNDPKCEL